MGRYVYLPQNDDYALYVQPSVYYPWSLGAGSSDDLNSLTEVRYIISAVGHGSKSNPKVMDFGGRTMRL